MNTKTFDNEIYPYAAQCGRCRKIGESRHPTAHQAVEYALRNRWTEFVTKCGNIVCRECTVQIQREFQRKNYAIKRNLLAKTKLDPFTIMKKKDWHRVPSVMIFLVCLFKRWTKILNLHRDTELKRNFLSIGQVGNTDCDSFVDDTKRAVSEIFKQAARLTGRSSPFAMLQIQEGNRV